ncbi:hypothetical protein [uncultured Nevskia sp.]|uniref:hypothetical protein n=1 Tax=uncultured Nevskia sp. TaxID=228950 RepID=UPI0025F997EF|nr:hypothetical protein [uncultured Nevskia sp.]
MRKNFSKLAVLAVVIVIAAAVTFWLTRERHGDEDYDYAAAFESLDPASGAPLFRIADVAGHTEAELAVVLGPPWDCESSLYSRRCRYAPGSTEVVFIEGKADWLTVRSPGEVEFNASALTRIGLVEKKPDQSTAEELIWTNLAGLREVRAVSNGDGVQMLRIKVKS